MTVTDLFSLLPLLVLAVTAVILLLGIAWRRSHAGTAILTALGFEIAFLSLFVVKQGIPHAISPLFVVDFYGLFYMGLLLAVGFFVVLISYGYLDRLEGEPREEYYLLLVLATLGALTLVLSNHFISLFLGLELLTVSLYGLIAYPRLREKSVEAGLKYLVLAGVSSSFLLFGMALVYANLGTMEWPRLAILLSEGKGSPNGFLLMGTAMMLVGLGFKLAVVPFHLWTPDVYEGAPAPVTAFVATASKGAVVAVLLRLFKNIGVDHQASVLWTLSLIAIASMFIGNLLALLQSNVKRILAYSSIAHLGYVLVAFLASATMRLEAVTYYLVAYSITTLAAFGVVTLLSGEKREAFDVNDYRGLFWRRPWVAAVFTGALLSLAGIPLTAGFVGKFYVLAAGVSSTQWLLVVALVVSSVVGLFYYLRLVVAMVQSPQAIPEGDGENLLLAPGSFSSLSTLGSVALILLTLLILWLGVYPSPWIHLVHLATAHLL